MRHDDDRKSDGSPRHDRAKGLRRSATTPERVLWSHLRDRRLGGLKFRRQHPIGPYVADFFCAEAKLVVELDGRTHQVERDERRDAYMRTLGIEVIRFPVSHFVKHQAASLERIQRIAEEKMKKGKNG